MKNNPFSGKIFVQGLRLLRLPGLIMAAAALGLTLLQTLTVLSQYLNTPKYSEAAVAVGSIYYTASFSASLFGALAPFILTLSVFSFLRKRRASDFYHSIPVTRVCLFLMYSLAVAAWSFLIILLPLIFNTAVFAIAGMPYSLPIFTSQLASLAALLVGALKVIGATALIMSITGNLFGNISMTAILLYVPVIVRNIYTAALSQVTGGIAFSNANTLTTGMTSFYYPLYYYLLYARSSSPLQTFPQSTWASTLGTLGVAGVYLGLALVAFRFRKSETAGAGASSPLLQHICRVAVTLPFVAYFPVTFLSEENFNLPALVSLGILSIVAYFSYELIVTRRFSALKKAAPVFLVVVGITFLGSIGLYAAKSAILGFAPSAEKIESIQVTSGLGSNAYAGILYAYLDNDYNSVLARDVEIKDPAAAEIVSQALKSAIEAAQKNNSNFTPSETEYNGEYAQKYFFRVKINTGIFSRTRIIRFTQDEFIELLERCREASEAFAEAETALPSLEEITSVSMMDMQTGSSVDDGLMIYKSFLEEAAELSPTGRLALKPAWYKKSYQNGSPQEQLHVSGKSKDGTAFSATYQIDSYYLPKTYAAALRNANKENKKQAEELFKKAEKEGIHFNFSVTYGETGNYEFKYIPGADYALSKDEMGELCDIILRSFENLPTYDNQHTVYNVYIYIGDNGQGIKLNSLTVDAKDFSRIKNLAAKNGQLPATDIASVRWGIISKLESAEQEAVTITVQTAAYSGKVLMLAYPYIFDYYYSDNPDYSDSDYIAMLNTEQFEKMRDILTAALQTSELYDYGSEYVEVRVFTYTDTDALYCNIPVEELDWIRDVYKRNILQ